ncbi:MAG: hypothetical protein FWC50_10595 [Planctomycetaceae bacterium]|nr:hypothetical protein [Planctomycetaceae bacterium]
MTSETTEYFDCIAFKRQAQKEMLEEFETNRDKFETYEDYIRWSSSQPTGNPQFDAFIKEVRERAGKIQNQDHSLSFAGK